MIGLDTNVLLRLLLDDEPQQSPRARELVAQHGAVPASLRLCDTVLLEALWTLSRRYRYSRPAVAAVFEQLLQEPAFAFDDRHRLREVHRHYAASKADIGDAFIAVDNRRAGCTGTLTFDTDALTVPGMQPAA